MVHFIKMEGCSNDYVFVDAGLTADGVDIDALGAVSDWAPRIADRHHGVGGDGLIVLSPGEKAPVRMRMWNTDGSEGLLCLNGLRCAAKYSAEETKAGDEFVVETAAGNRVVRVSRDPAGKVHEVEIEVGIPSFRRESLPALGTGEELWDETFYVGGMDLLGYAVSVGNPHLVLWMDEEPALWRAPLEEIGGRFADDTRFPEGINVHLVSRRGHGGLVMRSWERGSGATMSCGSGAAAAFAVARRRELVPSETTVIMPGGELRMRGDDNGALLMRGPAREVFRGDWDPTERK